MVSKALLKHCRIELVIVYIQYRLVMSIALRSSIIYSPVFLFFSPFIFIAHNKISYVFIYT